ncbi:hypothetical protein KKH23_06820 [Patescibacteria group bacterium]|uniref:Uncharacterized protein n=1 Tax=viral metagenome TaxID=1070528 RepID=A0A6M3MFA5_9ZZZZ|nr:hypothetical protein [Patescibacteria group bacterium]
MPEYPEGQLEVEKSPTTTGISVRYVGDTSKWTAKDQLKAARNLIRLLEAVDKQLHGKVTCKWVITKMEKDD